MRILLLAIGRMKAGPERELLTRYLERASHIIRPAGLTGLDWREIEESRARRAEDRKAEEAAALKAAMPAGAQIIFLDERGRSQSSPDFANQISLKRDQGCPALVFVIGGPDGIDPDLLKQGTSLAFGAMTWPHQLVRILLSEQIYRALTILTGHPYHRI